MSRLFSVMRDEEGATAIEYGLIAALIAVVLVAALTLVGGDLTNMFETISTELGGSGTSTSTTT